MSSNAKLAYLLSTCHKLNNGLMTVMTKQYEKTKTLATRHYFVLYINLYEPDQSSNFYVKDVYMTFANTRDPIFAEALQYYNAEILCKSEMKLIYNNLIKNNINLDAYQIVSLYSIATLIKLYQKHGFQYIFIPVVIDYGRGGNVVHQTALIIDISDKTHKFIYYEPYGLYTKFDKSYKEAVKTLLQCFVGFNIFQNDILYTTYHDLINQPKGIQAIIMDKNNARSVQFDVEYNNVIKELEKEFPDEDFDPDKEQKPLAVLDTKDKTIKILDLLFNFDYFNINLYSAEKEKKYYEILNKLLTYYCCYNSKTCVSITIVEMNKFFTFSQESNHNITDINSKLSTFYSKYDIVYPNIVLMKYIYEMLDLFKNANDIKEKINQTNQSHKICRKL